MRNFAARRKNTAGVRKSLVEQGADGMEIDYKALNERLCVMDARAALVEYIFKVQGAELRRLDYNAAAAALLVSRKTVTRFVGQLADSKVMVIIDAKIKINGNLISE